VFDASDLPRPFIRYGVGLWRRRWVIVVAAWFAALIGWFGVWLLPDKFESRAQVYVQTETILEPVMTGVTAQPNYAQRVQVMRLQLLTRPNVEEIIYRAGLDKTIKARSDIDRRAKMEKMIDWVASEIKIESPRDMYFIISYRCGDPQTARNVVDAVLNLLIEQDLGASLAEKDEARRLLDAEIARFDERLTTKEREVAEFRRTHAEELIVVEGQTRQREQRQTDLARIGDQLAQQQARVVTLQNLLAQTPTTSAGDELDKLKVQLAQLRSQFNENYPDIQNLKARIQQLESGTGALPSNPEHVRLRNELIGAENQVAVLKEQEERLRSDLESFAFTLGEAPSIAAELQRIVRDYEQTQKSYEELVQRRDRLALTASLGAGGQGVDYQVFERPEASLAPAAPPRLLLILVALLAAFVIGAGIAMLLTYLERTFTQAADLREKFGLPVLGSISVVKSRFLDDIRRADLIRLAAACAGLVIFGLLYIYLTVLRLPSVEETAGAQTASAVVIGEIRPWG
jgi:polysaccharide chain length determinant protein (PEP-CTERM system associated)